MKRRFAFFGIIWAYIWLVSLYAISTPAWQVPDEPAHYNYVRYMVEQAALPVLSFGDYDQNYLEAIKAQKFPASMSIDSIRYESHQPPLYYAVMLPFYLAGDGASLPMRLLGMRLASALLGAPLLAIVYRIGREIAPNVETLPVLATAFVAFVPQHLAMLAGVENDTLADVLLAGAALGLLRVMRLATVDSASERSAWWAVGLMVGFGLVTKTTTYVSVGLITVTLLLLWRDGSNVRRSLRFATPALIFALLVGTVWFVRDALVYGPLDWLGLARHNAVVVGQPRTLDLYGSYWNAATYYFPIMFRSFWGQFGWMGVPLDARTYSILFGLTLFVLVGLMILLMGLRGGTSAALDNIHLSGLVLLGAWITLTFVATVGYSLEFFQAQGRYLFPALSAIGVFGASGVQGWLQTLTAGHFRSLPSTQLLSWLVAAGVYALLFMFALFCLYRFLIPGLVA